MLTLRCTERLLKKRPGPQNQREDGLKPALGDWHANLVRLGRTPVVVAVNDVSLLSILIPGRDFGNLLSTFRDRLMQRLIRLGVPAERMAEEAAATKCILVSRTDSRSVLGSMNDFVFQLRWRFNEGLDLHASDTLEDDLGRVPMSALKYADPEEVARAAFGLR